MPTTEKRSPKNNIGIGIIKRVKWLTESELKEEYGDEIKESDKRYKVEYLSGDQGKHRRFINRMMALNEL